VRARHAERRGKEAGGLRRKIETCGIRGTNDKGETVQRFAVQAKFFDHHIEGAELAAVAPEYPLDIERRRTKSVGDMRDLGGRDEKEDGRRIDEAADEPRASDAVDLRPRTCDPNGASLLVRFRHMIRTHQQAFAFDPGFEAAATHR
jgi:hypothetical protein